MQLTQQILEAIAVPSLCRCLTGRPEDLRRLRSVHGVSGEAEQQDGRGKTGLLPKSEDDCEQGQHDPAAGQNIRQGEF